MRRLLPALLLSGCSASPPIDPDATPVVVAEGFSFTEGPVADGAGRVYFTDQPSDRILVLGPGGEVEVFLAPAGRANGLALDGSGNLLACADERGELWSIDPTTREVEVLVAGYEGRRLNGPNDLWVDPEGGVWFTDPFYRRPYWSHGASEQDGEHVYHLARDGTLTVAARGFERPNGIIGSADGARLYVADIGASRTYVHPILGPGRLGARRLLIEQGSDGLALDDHGHLYLTGAGVTVVDVENGTVVASVSTGERRASNATFRGRTLVITARDAVLLLETRVGDGSR